MTLIKKGEKVDVFTPEAPVEKHFHDYDETWFILEGRARAYMIDHDGRRSEFLLEAGDCWMIGVGCEHAAAPITPEFKLVPVRGTRAPGAHEPGHYYMEKEGYIPHLELRKVPTDRYGKERSSCAAREK